MCVLITDVKFGFANTWQWFRLLAWTPSETKGSHMPKPSKPAGKILSQQLYFPPFLFSSLKDANKG